MFPRRLLLLLAAASISASASDHVAQLRPFDVGSLARIEAEHQGRPFILSIWSTECVYCVGELKSFAALKKAHPKLDLVLLAADPPEAMPTVREIAGRQGVGQIEQWIFSDTAEERLRYDIDPAWFGDLPRTYFYDARHRREAVSGVVPSQRLSDWAREYGH